MNNKLKNTRTLFLFRNDEELKAAYREIDKGDYPDNAILQVSNDAPFLLNQADEKNGVSNWTNIGIRNFDTSRFWLENYKKIDALFDPILMNKDVHPLLKSDFLKIDLASIIGEKYLLPLMELNKLFRSKIINSVFIKPDDSFITHLIIRLCELNDVKPRELVL